MVLRGGPKGEAHVPSKSTKKQVRDADLRDSTGSIPMSIWGEHITSVKEGELYAFTECRLRHYYGKCLTTTQSTTVSAAEKQDISKAVQQDVQTWIWCPDILNVAVNPGHTGRFANVSVRQRQFANVRSRFANVKCQFANANLSVRQRLKYILEKV